MADDRLGRDLRKLDAPETPRAEFVEALFARLVDERGLPSARAVVASVPRPRDRARGRGPLLLAAALLIGGAVVGSVMLGSGTVRHDPDVRAAPVPVVSVAPSPTARPRVSIAARPSLLAIAPSPTGLAALPGTGTVVYELRTIGAPTRLMQIDSNGSGGEFAPDVPGMQTGAAWSPDGAHLVFAAAPIERPQAGRIWRTDAGGGSPTLVSTDCRLPDCQGETEPAYSPDGRRLAFVRTASGGDGGPGTSVVAIRDVETGTVTELTSTTQRADRSILHPSFSPDGSVIAFGVSGRGATFESATAVVWRVGTDDSGLTRLTADTMVAGDPTWSPDGTRILFATYPIRTIWAENQRALDISHLFTMAPDGSDVRRLPLPDQVGGASWVPGGAAILYTAIVSAGTISPGFTWLMTVDADATEVHAISRGNNCCSWYAVQQPTP